MVPSRSQAVTDAATFGEVGARRDDKSANERGCIIGRRSGGIGEAAALHLRARSIVLTGNRDRHAPSALMTVLRRAKLFVRRDRISSARKKTGPLRARPQVRQRGGASKSPSRGEETANLRLPIWEDHGQSQVRQHANTMQSDSASHNVATGMPAMRCQHGRPDKFVTITTAPRAGHDKKNAMHRVRSMMAKSKADFGKDHAPTTFARGRRQHWRTSESGR